MMDEQGAIGGYFGLETGYGSRCGSRAELAYQSARAAFLALLECGKPRRVWMPWFICDSMCEPPKMLGIPISRYAIDKQYRVADDVDIHRGDWLLYVNYFGLCNDGIDDALSRFSPAQVVVDNAQALYERPRHCLASISSPRKFFGVPDGGFLTTTLKLNPPAEADGQSHSRCIPLLQRLELGPEAGYKQFVAAEETLAMQPPRKMSALTTALLDNIDYAEAAHRRRRNFVQLADALGKRNHSVLSLAENSVPLCYPYVVDDAQLRTKLVSNRIFVPAYWPELLQGDRTLPPVETGLSRHLAAIPCDQRYGDEEMKRIIDIIQKVEVRSR